MKNEGIILIFEAIIKLCKERKQHQAKILIQQLINNLDFETQEVKETSEAMFKLCFTCQQMIDNFNFEKPIEVFEELKIAFQTAIKIQEAKNLLDDTIQIIKNQGVK